MKQLILILVSVVSALAQNGRIVSGTTATTSASGLITSSGVSGAVAFPSQAGIPYNCAHWDSNGSVTWIACGGGPSYETRKDDGKGPTLLQIKSESRRLAEAELPPTQYVALAKLVGLDGPVIEQAKILETINNLNLHVYDWAKVDGYLYRQALRQKINTRWVWKPIRKSDMKAVADMSMLTKDDVGMVSAKLYARPLPVRVLNRMKEIECEFADVVFLISDYEVVKPDPFLAITTKDLLESGKIWIIDQWDEPSFRDGPQLQAKSHQ